MGTYQRDILTGIGPVRVAQPRVDDRNLKSCSQDDRFKSNILPRYLRRIPSIDNLIPTLYLKGISTNDFICHTGPGCPGAFSFQYSKTKGQLGKRL
jgi:transposase-like protein